MQRARRFPLILVWFVALACWSCSVAQAQSQTRYYPGKLKIERGENLARDEREVEAGFAEYLEKNTDQAIARYRQLFGNVINADNARELSRDYAPQGFDSGDAKAIEARTRWSNAVHEPASALVAEIYRRELQKPADPNQLDRVVFTAGGTAAGKTSAIRRVPPLANVIRVAQIIYDSTLSRWESAESKIVQAFDAAKTVSVVYVYRDPVEAFVNGALSQPDRRGRTVPLAVYVRTHLGSAQVLLRLAEKYRADPRISISVIDNSRGRGNAAVADLDFVRRVAHKYSPEELKTRLLRALEQAYEKGKRQEKGGISESAYRAFKGNATEGIH